MTNAAVQETLDMLKGLGANGNGFNRKSFTVATGLVAYDLEPAAKLEYPVLTPLRNSIERVTSNRGDTATRWRQIVAINTNKVKAGVSEGNRGGVIATTVTSSLAAYKGIGLEDNVTFEADYAATGYDDPKARAVQGLLNAVFIEEEKTILDGNTSIPLPVPAAPTSTASGAGGLMTAQTWVVLCVALTGDGYRRASVSGGLVATITRTNADASVDTMNGGCSQVSPTPAGVALTGGQLLYSSVPVVRGAMAYAWYYGSNAANAVLGAITTLNSNVMAANPTGTQTVPAALAADCSTDALTFDGLLPQTINGNGYYYSMPTGTAGTGTPLTMNNAGGVVEIDNALKWFWDNYKVWPTVLWVSSQELVNLTNKILANGGSSTIRFNVAVGNNLSNITAGAVIASYINKFAAGGGSALSIRLHPYLTPGTMFFWSDTLPYPASGISTLARIKQRQPYYQIEWALRTRKYEYGVYVDEVLQMYATFPFGVITNIANG